MQINRVFEEDIVGVNSFVDKVFVDYEDVKKKVHASIRSHRNEGIFSLNNDNEIVVIASVHSSTWHPHCVYVCLAYEFNQANESKLHIMKDFLKDKYEKPLFFLIDERFNCIKESLLQSGLRLIRKTEVIHIDPEKSLMEAEKNDQEIKSISEIVNEPTLMSNLIALSKKVYRETHLDNPVADLPNLSWEKAIMHGLLCENSYVVREGNDITAFSFMYEDKEDSWELGWIGIDDMSKMPQLDLLINKQLRDAEGHRIVRIEKEVDSTCPYSMHIAQSLTYDVSETLHSYLLGNEQYGI